MTILISVFLFLISANSVQAQPALDIRTQPIQEKSQTTERIQKPTPSSTTQVIHPQTTTQPQSEQNQLLNQWTQTIQDLQNQIKTLEDRSQNSSGDPRITNWLGSWWLIGFWGGILLLFPWVFVGWQWSRLGFWGFGWPWPWWFWLPLIWFIPWLVIGWQWWLVWWVWWVWIWWLFPWLFWLFWWVILFKEMTIAQWNRRKGSAFI